MANRFVTIEEQDRIAVVRFDRGDRANALSAEAIREGMAGALCRCMTYYRIQAAIKRVVRGTAASIEETPA